MEAQKIKLENLLDAQDVMQILHISKSTLLKLRTSNTLPHTRINDKIYYLKDDIEKILTDNYTNKKP